MRLRAGTIADSTERSRRTFLRAGAAALGGLCLPQALQAQTGAPTTLQARLSITPGKDVFTLPKNYTGLSYESAQLANPAFFAPENKALVALFRELTTEGVLRLGGGTSEYTTYSDQPPSGPPPFEVFGPDTSKTDKKGTVTTALALGKLRGFLDATGWSCLYGLNLGQGSRENAAAEAEAAYRILGPRLLALQIGNEPDSFRNRFRSSAYTAEDFVDEWTTFHDAIVERVPAARFAGPDISNKFNYVTAFAAAAARHPDVILLTGHYYAMGPAGKPDATLDNLLSADPKSTTMKWAQASVIAEAMQTAHLPFRMSEGNSCWNGGQAGVSDTFGSALWCADAMLHFATLGWSGVNLHGGGNGLYSPIVGSPLAGFERRPEFFGIQLAQHFAGSTLLETKLSCDSDRVRAYAAHHAGKGQHQMVVINKTPNAVALGVEGLPKGAERWARMELTAPAIDAKSDVRLAPAPAVKLGAKPVQVAPYSAVLFTAKG